jgi:hypothetical protein
MTVKKRAAAAAMVLYAALGAAGAAAQAPLSPREALGALKAGNDRFARNASSPVSLSVNRRQELAIAQHPIAMVLSWRRFTSAAGVRLQRGSRRAVRHPDGQRGSSTDRSWPRSSTAPSTSTFRCSW